MADFLSRSSGSRPEASYALLALALVLIYRSTGVINFAQGEMAMFSTFICWELTQRDVPCWGSVLPHARDLVRRRRRDRAADHPAGRERQVLTVVTVTISC